MGDHLVKHGDGVKDIAFTVENCDFLVQVIQVCMLEAHSVSTSVTISVMFEDLCDYWKQILSMNHSSYMVHCDLLH